jgi:8-oxo-dGTP pyrophosphatase MutT (NUDIX family)
MRVDRFVVNVEVAVVRNGRYVSMVRGAGVSYGRGWRSLPGGKLDHDGDVQNALEETARREVMEEVGLPILDPIVYVESHVFDPGNGPVLDVIMLARAGSGEPWAASPAEAEDVAWLGFDDFIADPGTQPWTIASLRLAEAKRRDLGW